MKVPDLVRLMCELGVPRNPATLANMIRFVQECEGNPVCFNSKGGHCDRRDCAWRQLCVRSATERESVLADSCCQLPRMTSLTRRNVPIPQSCEVS